jgi:hypothetical protein
MNQRAEEALNTVRILGALIHGHHLEPEELEKADSLVAQMRLSIKIRKALQ